MNQSVFVMDTPRDCLHCKMRSVIYDSDRGYQHCGFDTDGYKLESFFSERDLSEGWISPKCPLIFEKDFINKSEIQKDSWIPVSERLPEYENKDGSWVRCIVKVMRSHYPTSTYDDCDSPYDETLVMCAKYDVKQKIWHLDCDEQLNALIDIDDSPMNGDYVIEWMSLKSLY